MKRFLLKKHGVHDCPDPCPLVVGQHGSDYDVDEGALLPEIRDRMRRYARERWLRRLQTRGMSPDDTLLAKADATPVGLDRRRLPPGAILEEVA